MKTRKKMTADAAVKEYADKVYENLLCSKAARAFFMRELRQNLAAFVSEHEDAGYDELAAEFGDPTIFGGEFTDRLEYAELLRKARKKATFWKCVGIVLALITVAVIVLCLLFVHAVTGEYIPRRPIF